MLRFIKLIILILAVLIVAVFAGHNDQAVSVNLFPFEIQFEISLFVVVFTCIVFGVLVSGLFTSLRLIYWKRVARNAQKNLAKLEKQKQQLPAKQD